MIETRPVYIHGVAVEFSWADGTRNLGELIFDVVHAAVVDSKCHIDDIDSVVLGAHDLVDGRSLSSMVTAPSAGAYLKDEIRFGDDGAAALAAAMTRVESGESARSIVAAWGRASEGDVDAISRSLFDPGTGRPLGLEETTVSGFRAQRWITEHGASDWRADAVRRRRESAAGNPRGLSDSDSRRDAPFPLTSEEMPVWGDVVAALIISSEPGPVRITGMGQSSESYFIGDRDLLGMPALQSASARALGEAGRSIDELDIIEIDGLSLFDEAIGLEAIGLASAGGGIESLVTDDRVNRSGGSAAGYCAPAMGLVRVVEAVLQLQGRAGEIQRLDARIALATGSSTIAAQTQTALVLESI